MIAKPKRVSALVASVCLFALVLYNIKIVSNSQSILESLSRSRGDHPPYYDDDYGTTNTTQRVLDSIDNVKNCVPFYGWMEKHMKEGRGKRNQPKRPISLVGSYAFPDHIVVTTDADGRYGNTIYCRYLDKHMKEIKPAVKSVFFPEFTVYCCQRSRAEHMSITLTEAEEIRKTVPISDRKTDNPRFTLSMCVRHMYGMEPKFVLFAEFVEHYKLQGVQHFYIYVKDVDDYTNKLITHYVESGEAEVVYFKKEQDRPSVEWHLAGTQDCTYRSRHDSEYTIYADLDERILPADNTKLISYVRKTMPKEGNIGMIRFLQRWVLRNSTDPQVYEGNKTLLNHLPTLVFHNTSAVAPIGHTAKCITDPKKVFLMWVHWVEIYFDGYKGYEVPLSEGIIRHYRDIRAGDWYRHYLPGVEKFGAFTMTDYPKHLMMPLFENVKRKLDIVYGK
ncbi:hypothetical protein Q1695_007765 [Nippostrongylus brasiliensis]|nr:hypothetical protein Q1695_007765 [Nippostrongylus brasiliensis]